MSGARAIEAKLGAELIAVLVAVTAGTPRVLTIEDGRALASGPFAASHRSLQAGLRDWVEEQTRHPLGYVEQLYTFADRDRGAAEERAISISHLGLTRETRSDDGSEAGWRDWYGFFPWENHREAAPAAIALVRGIRPAILRARAAVWHLVKIEVEDLDGLDEALESHVDAVLLDNMGPDLLALAVERVASRAVTEASGRITPATAGAVAASGVDLISIGWLTHSAPVLDIGLDHRA